MGQNHSTIRKTPHILKIALQIRWFLFLALGVGLSFPGAYGLQNVSVYGLIVVSIFCVLRSKVRPTIPSIVFISMGYFIYLLSFEVFADQNWAAFLKKMPLLLSLLVVFPPTKDEKNVFFNSIGISTIVSCLYLWIHHFLELVPEERWLMNSYSYTFLTESLGWQPIYTAISYSIGGLFWLNRVQISSNYWWKILGMFGITILFVSLIFLSARMALIAFILTSAIVVPAKRRWIYGVGICLATSLIFMNPVLKERLTKAISGSERYAGGSIRLEKWKAAKEVSLNHWIFGVSSGKSQQKLDEQYQKQGFQLGIEQHYHAHQQWLQNTVEGGVFGFAFLLLVIVAFFKLNFQRDDQLVLAIGLFILLNTFTESICERQTGMIWFCLIFLTGFVQKSDNRSVVVHKESL